MTRYSEYLFIKRYHEQMMRILWRIYKHLTVKLSIPDIYDLETEITELEKIFEQYCESS